DQAQVRILLGPPIPLTGRGKLGPKPNAGIGSRSTTRRTTMEEMLRRSGYRVMVEGEERMQIAARHWGDASSPVFYRLVDDHEWKQSWVTEQCGDSRHRPRERVIMIGYWLRHATGERIIGHDAEFELAHLDHAAEADASSEGEEETDRPPDRAG